VYEALKLPKVWVLSSPGKLFPMKSHFTHTTASECRPSTPADHPARLLFWQWLLEKFVVNIQFVANILFTDEA
jgi:hypothetical protein